MRGRTRRDEIVGEHRREQIRVIALIGATLVLLISLMVSCGKSCGCGCGCGCGGSEPVMQVGGEEEKTEQDSGELVLTGEDTAFLSSVAEYPCLVNRENPLPFGYAPPNPVILQGMPNGTKNMLNYDAANAFTVMRDAMMKDGIAVDPLSGYRTYDEQVSIFNYNVELHVGEGMTPEEAREYTERFVALPGTSEHQYGRSIDVTIDGTTNHSFHETEQGKWLIDHAHEYGFIIRYPEDKADITGINYEPWHLRWVGEEHASFMHRHGICLEEYARLVLQYNPGAVMFYD